LVEHISAQRQLAFAEAIGAVFFELSSAARRFFARRAQLVGATL
jgi:hypothetical protein